MTDDRGVKSRKQRLRPDANKPVHLLALDHGLSLGWTDSQQSPRRIADAMVDLGASGVLCHSGLLENLTIPAAFPAILQLHGSTLQDASKVPISTVQKALNADCVGIAVEHLTEGPSESLALTASLVQEARAANLVVLVMANYTTESFSAMSKAIAAASQLGPDYIKVRMPNNPSDIAQLSRIEAIVAEGPPTLLAGGESNIALESSLSLAVSMSFQGTCIGRHYFDAEHRYESWRLVKNFFNREEQE